MPAESVSPSPVAPPAVFTPWGWPLPYRSVAGSAIAWLQGHGWWPIGLGYQPLWSGQNAVMLTLQSRRLLEQRGLQAMILPFASGVALEQAFVAGQLQVASLGTVSAALLLDRGAPVQSVLIQTPNLKVGIVVPRSSPLARIGDLRGSGQRIGVQLDSRAYAYLLASAAANGLSINRDFFPVGMDLESQQTLPSNVAGVATWEPILSFLTDNSNTGRLIDRIYPYLFVGDHLIVRRELIEAVPEVVQALVDAYEEAVLIIRLDPTETVQVLTRQPHLDVYSQPFLRQQTVAYTTLYKPTFTYPFLDFWSTGCAQVAALLVQNGLISRPIDQAAWMGFLEPRFVASTFNHLGWAIPSRPPWLPASWTGTVGQPPYPPYLTVDTLRQPQPWPEPADLTRPWSFGGTIYFPASGA